MGNPFTAVARWIGRTIKKIWQGNEEALLDDFKGLALVICEAVTGLDLDGDGRRSAVAEIVGVARTTGVKWGARFLDEVGETVLLHMHVDDLRRYVALARLTSAILGQFGAKALPATRVLNLVIEIAVNLLAR